ncbi:MAG: endonuclease III [Candidatus Bathyarchaeia archaeon]
MTQITVSSEHMGERIEEIIERLEDAYPEVRGTALHWRTPLDLLVATILSAQTTDQKVNEVTKELFKRYKTAADYANAPREELEEAIKSLNFYRQKAGFIQEACRRIVEEYGGEVPRSMEGLMRLKGVARKTANIVLGNAYGIVEGIAVDTHVMRLSRRLGLTAQEERDKIERDLMEVVPRDRWFQFSNLIIEHGRRVCKARKPNCEGCVLKDICPSAYSF